MRFMSFFHISHNDQHNCRVKMQKKIKFKSLSFLLILFQSLS